MLHSELPSDSREIFPQPLSARDRGTVVGDILWHDPDDEGCGYDLPAVTRYPDTGERWGIDCVPDLPNDQFCSAGYLAALECGMEFWPIGNPPVPSLCPAHWQLLLTQASQRDPHRAIQNANAQALALYEATARQLKRSARASARRDGGETEGAA